MPRAEDGKHRKTNNDTAAHGDRGKQARIDKGKENNARAIGKDPNHPAVGSQAWAKQHHLPGKFDKTKPDEQK